MDITTNLPRLRTHAAAIAHHTLPILERFVDGFSSTCPAARRVFALDTKRQRFDAAAAVSEVCKNIGHPAYLRPWLADVGHWLASEGFTQQHAPAACEAMLDAIRSCSGVNWSAEIESEWRVTVALVFSMMAEGMPEGCAARPMRMAA